MSAGSVLSPLCIVVRHEACTGCGCICHLDTVVAEPLVGAA